MPTDPNVDAFIATAQPFAKPILEHLRALVHRIEPEAGEAIKWGMPHFTLNGKNLCGMGAFKAHCAFIVEGAGERGGNGMGHYGKIRTLDDVPAEDILTGLIQAGAARIRAGERRPAAARAPKPDVQLPDDLASALTPAARSFYDGLSPSAQREYADWITSAKRPETRTNRITQAAGLLADGKKRYWKYS